MRIVNRKEFMSLPSYIVYAKYYNYVIGELCIKTSDKEWSENDFIVLPVATLNFIESNDCNDRIDIIEEMLNDSTLLKEMDYEATSRDGFYNEDELYVVFENNDIKNMINNLSMCLK